MDFTKLQQTWGSIRFENHVHRIALPILALAVIVMTFATINTKPIVVVQPPNMNEKVQVAADNANKAFKKGYGTYVANILGNLHTGNTSFLLASIEHMLSSRVYHDVREDILANLEHIESERLAVSFDAHEVTFWEDTNRIVVTGLRETRGRSDSVIRETVTYEMEINISNYMPKVTWLKMYEGQPERSS